MRAISITLVLIALACGTKRAEVISLGPSHDASPAADGSGDSGGLAEEVGSGGSADSAGAPGTGGADFGSAPEAAIETAIAPEAATDGEDCTTLPNTAPLVPVTTGDDRVATGVGGTVAAGTYYLTSVVRTPSSILPQMTFHQTLRISGNTIESVAQDNDKPAYTVVSTFTTSGASIAFSLVCSTQNGSGGDLQYDSYTADDSHLILYGVTIGITVTFTRQG
jgi:hypothetical protein